MNPFASLAELRRNDLPARYRFALAAGAEVLVAADDERLLAADEIVALAIPGLVALRAVTLVLDAALLADPAVRDAATARRAAGVLRLIDCALEAHGRQHRYLTDAWREQALDSAHSHIYLRCADCSGPLAVGPLVNDVADALARVVPALHRDRLAVPAALADALATQLTIYLHLEAVR